MPPVLTSASVLTCPHAAGQVAHTPSQTRVVAVGAPALTQADTNTIAGCPFTIGTKPSPCVTVRWTVAAARVTAGGVPLLLQSSVGLCSSPEQAPQGPPLVTVVQPRVQGL
jgi:hypothetical protein